MSEIESPCIGVCSLNPETGQCHGCCRTSEEIEKWFDYTDKEKLAVLEELEKRQNDLFGD